MQALAAALALVLTPFWIKAAEPVSGDESKPAIELAVPFTDNMILQRGSKVPVWGWTDPGAKVTVEFAGQRKTGTADKDGEWMIKLDSLVASAEERELKVSSGQDSVILKNVLVGEIWFSSGQSNMVWTAGKSM